LTTRSQTVGAIAAQVELAEMEPAKGLKFLILRSRIAQDEIELDIIASDIRKEAQELVALLGGHPLALDQAGAYVEETGVSFAEYMRLFREHRNILRYR